MRRRYIPLGIVVVLTVAATAGIMAWGKARAGSDERRVIVDGIERIGKLVTVEYHMSAHVLKTKGRAWYEWKNAKYFAVATGKVRGSVNLKKASIEVSRDPSDQVVTIVFASDAVEVSKPEIKPGDIMCRKISDPNVFHKITDADYNRARDEALESMTRVALEQGIAERTMERAEVLLREFLSPMGYRLRTKFEGASPQAKESAELRPGAEPHPAGRPA